MKKKNNLVLQGSILAIAGIIARLIGLLRRIPLTNIIGNVGNSYYSTAYAIYNIMLIISSYSLPLAVSKLVSARLSKHQYKNAQKAFYCAMAFAIVSGGSAFAAVEIFADWIANQFVMTPMSAMALKVLGPALLIVSVMGVFRGYFQGIGTMMPTAVSQIIEQIFVVIVSLAGAMVLFGRGEKVGALLHNENYAPAYGAAGASLGPVVGAIVGLGFLVLVYMAYRPKVKYLVRKDVNSKEESYSTVLRIMLLTIVPVLLSTTVYNISEFIDIRIYNQVMIEKGFAEVKDDYWGVYTGQYKILINVPLALANAMCSSVVPVLTGLLVKSQLKDIEQKINQAMRFTMMITIPSAVGLAVLASPIISMLFPDKGDLAVNFLQIGSISVVFLSMSTLTNGVLQGINKVNVPVIHSAIALVIHVAVLYLMLQMDMGIEGVIYSNIVFAVIMCVLNALAIRREIHFHQEWVRTFVIPFVSALIMGGVILGLSKLLTQFMGNILSVIVCILVGVVVYFVALILLKGLTETDMKSMPGGRTLLTIAKKCKLM
ncbi:MAG: polysaccharide biosynthesis protein [Lachnospiraceae bacterium]|nr:polysaccharide biosynthesis protein [Lachnospiraceae bacterium]